MHTVHTVKGTIDSNDLAHFVRLGGDPIAAMPCPRGGNGVINPHVTRFFNRDGSVTDIFHIKPIYYEALDHSWRPMSEVATYHGNTKIILKTDWARRMTMRYFLWLMKRQLLFPGKELLIEGLVIQPRHMVFNTTDTYYPDPHAESTTVDGSAAYDDASYSTARNAATGENAEDSISGDTGVQHSKYSGIYYIRRMFWLFDTSSIPDGDTISAATLSYYQTDTGNGADSGHTVAIVSSTPASNTAIVAADYDMVGSTSFGSGSYTGTANTYHDFSLNSSGISNISKTGVSKFGGRGTEDISNTAPTGLNQGTINRAEATGTTTDPKLAVTHASTGLTVNATAQALTFSIPAPEYKHGSTVSPSVQAATFSIPAYSIVGKAVVAANAALATFSIPSYSVSAGGNKTVNANVQELTFSVPSYAVSVVRSIAVAVNAVVATFSTPSRTVSVGYGVTVAATVALLTFSLPAIALTIVRYITVSVGVIALTFTIPTLRKAGGVWRRITRSTSGSDWTRKEKNNT